MERQKLVDMRLETPVPAGDRREIEIVVKHLHYVRGNVPLACDVTLVSPLTTAGEARPRATEENGIAIQAAEKAKAEAEKMRVAADKATAEATPIATLAALRKSRRRSTS